jgi:hypothetical protein
MTIEEEILGGDILADFTPYKSNDAYGENDVLEAMQRYADQQCAKKQKIIDKYEATLKVIAGGHVTIVFATKIAKKALGSP